MRKVRGVDYILAFVIVCIAMTLTVVVAFAAPSVPDGDGVDRAFDEHTAEPFPASDQLSVLRRGWSRSDERERPTVPPATANPHARVVDLVEPFAAPPSRESL